MKFDVVIANPPFQDRVKRGRTPHKLWIKFTERTFEQWLRPGGLLVQVSPASFQSPSNRILALMQDHQTIHIDFDAGEHFAGVGSTFAWYIIENRPRRRKTTVKSGGKSFSIALDRQMLWLPSPLTREALRIHDAVMFKPPSHLDIRHDYVTCHNSRLRTTGTLSKTRTPAHRFPVLHTNPQTWYSSVRQPWSKQPKVMWSRSGYTKPFFDPGRLGGTDMAYYVPVADEEAGNILVANLQHPLMRYVLSSARWSGFGNEVVFSRLPAALGTRRFADTEMDEFFGLSAKESAYARAQVGGNPPAAR